MGTKKSLLRSALAPCNHKRRTLITSNIGIPTFHGIHRHHLVPRSLQIHGILTSDSRTPTSPLWMETEAVSEVEDNNGDDKDGKVANKTLDSVWDVSGLKKEVARLIQRSYKKIGKTNQRLQSAMAIVDQLRADDDATLEQLAECPNVEALETELQELQQRLRGLNELEEKLKLEKNRQTILPESTASLALALDVSDRPPARPQRIRKKKGPRSMEKSRLPYRRYYSHGGVEIRVGKKAEDNDELSLSPNHRDGADWWMHASGCPGSHVVIRFHGPATPHEEVIQDAAALAARQSKCNGNVIKVSMTQCRDVKKPPGAKPGLVMLTGMVRTITVNVKQAEQRLDRLEKTVMVN